MNHLDLFSGIGGFALAVDTVWPESNHTFCEIDPFCQAILKKHWPQSYIYADIRSLTNTRSQKSCGVSTEPRQAVPALGACDLITGGFPCQPFSHAGKRKGTDDERHLWPEMRRVIQEFSPRFVVAENVRGLLSIDGGLVFEQVCVDLEALGYEVQPFVIPACAVNAPHRRDRVWIIGHAKHNGFNGSQDRQGRVAGSHRNQKGEDKLCESKGSTLARQAATYAEYQPKGDEKCGGHDQGASGRVARPDRHVGGWSEDWPQVAARLCPLDDGLPGGLARPYGWRNAALKAAGNAIVPQVAIEIFKALKV